MKQKVIAFLKKETVLVAAFLLAAISAFFVKPSQAYLDYIDWRTLGILLSLMTVMAGLQENGFFNWIGRKLLEKTENTRQLVLVLVFLCYFFSMFITNDVALLTFVPFSILILGACGQEKILLPVVILQTLAANLGSMLTPIGNPQNLYLYQLSGMGVLEFVEVMLPYTLVSGLLLLGVSLVITRKKEKAEVSLIEDGKVKKEEMQQGVHSGRKNGVYLCFFVLSLLVVARWIPFWVVLGLVLVVTFWMDRHVLGKVDYFLLLTFVGFFIFTGNMGQLPVVREGLQQFVSGKEVLIGILASQCISNVPATLLLSGFTTDVKALLVGVNLGGLGTLIASMASLISYKIYVNHASEKKGSYFLWFTIANVFFLLVLLVEYVGIGILK
ncbi:MAG: SLC13 family permease [Roseburia sp.]